MMLCWRVAKSFIYNPNVTTILVVSPGFWSLNGTDVFNINVSKVFRDVGQKKSSINCSRYPSIRLIVSNYSILSRKCWDIRKRRKKNVPEQIIKSIRDYRCDLVGGSLRLHLEGYF